MAKDYQYVFIGCGVAGATVAKRLLEQDPGTSILMLEAGPEVKAKDRRYWWDYVVLDRKPYAYCYDVEGENETIGDINWGYNSSRVMAYGGSTVHWGAWCLRYKREDFNLFTNTGEGADWPIDYEDLEDYYYEAEHYLSVCGDADEGWNERQHQPYPRPPFEWTAADGVMLEAFERIGAKPGKMPIARYRKCMTTGTCKYCPFGSRFSAQYVLDDLRSDPRHTDFEIRCHSPVTRLVTDSSKSRIEAIEYTDTKTGQVHRINAQTFIVCSGTYESAKLLLRSKSAHWSDGVGNDHDLVGRFIVSHSFLRVKGDTPRNPGNWFQEYDFPTLMSRSYDTPEYQKDGKIFIFKNRVLPNVDIGGLMQQGKSRKEIDEILRGPMQMELQAFYEEKGLYGNRLTLKEGTNRFGLPLTRIEYMRDPRFFERAQKRLAVMNEVITQMGYTIAPGNSKFDDPGGHHATSTCRMATTPEQGVTDRDLKVFGTDNLFVCSNATFPTCTAVNPTLTLTAISMRLGDHLNAARGLPAGPSMEGGKYNGP